MSDAPGKPIRFISQENPQNIITVYDLQSFQLLNKLINTHCHEDWVIDGAPSARDIPSTGIALEPPSLIPVAPPPKAPPPKALPAFKAPPPLPPQSKKERRKNPRFPAQFRAIFIIGTRSFRTTSCDVSASGMRIKDPLPANMLDKACRVFIGSPDLKENIEFHCVVIKDPESATRIQFQNPDAAATQRLMQWLKLHHGSKKDPKAA